MDSAENAYRVNDAAPEDVPELLRVKFGDNIDDCRTLVLHERMRERIQSPKGGVLKAEQAAIVGYLAFEMPDERPGIGCVTDLYAAYPQRGVGKSLLDAFFRLAKAVELTATEESLGYYRKQGFEISDKTCSMDVDAYLAHGRRGRLVPQAGP